MNIHPRLIALNMLQVYQKYMQAICQDNKRWCEYNTSQ
jgi:hypothetical protein